MNAADITHEHSEARAKRAFQWANDVYGLRARNSRIVAFRMLEEAMELAQTQGLSFEDMVRVAKYVSDRRPGDTKVEIGDLRFMLDTMATNLGLSVDSCHTDTLLRVQSLDPAKCLAKDDDKIAAGLI